MPMFKLTDYAAMPPPALDGVIWDCSSGCTLVIVLLYQKWKINVCSDLQPGSLNHGKTAAWRRSGVSLLGVMVNPSSMEEPGFFGWW